MHLLQFLLEEYFRQPQTHTSTNLSASLKIGIQALRKGMLNQLLIFNQRPFRTCRTTFNNQLHSLSIFNLVTNIESFFEFSTLFFENNII